MKIRLHRLSRFSVCAALLLCAGGTASARRHAPGWTAPSDSPGSEPAALPTEKTPTINPEAAPSLSLQPFVDAHLDKILAPLGTAACTQSDLVTALRDGYAKALPATTDARKPAYQLAMATCDALANAITERQKAVTALKNVYDLRTSQAVQPRGGQQAVKDSDKDEAFFYNSQKNNWLQNAAPLRQQIVTLFQRERAAEAQAGGPWISPAAAATPTVAASNKPTAADPVVGQWKWDGYLDVSLNSDHSIGNKRQGTWLLADAADGKRHYEFHYDNHADWVDTLTLSTDGKSLEGANKYGKYVSAQRE